LVSGKKPALQDYSSNRIPLLMDGEVKTAAFEYMLGCDDHGIRIIDLRQNVLFINQTFADMCGVSPREAIGKPCWQVFASSSCHTVECRFQRVLGGQEMVKTEINRGRRDGTEIPCLVTAAALRSQQGELLGIIEKWRDISAHKHRQSMAAETEERCQSLIELGTRAGEAIVMLQDTAGKEGAHVFVNDEWVRITGYSKQELLDASFFDLLKTRDRAESIVRHRKKLSGVPVPGLFEMTVTRKDGTTIPIEVTGGFTTYNGSLANVVYARDITQRKAAEQSLADSEKRLQTILDNLQEGCILLDREYRYLYMNKVNETLSRIPLEDSLGRTLMETHPGIETTPFFERVRDTLENHTVNRLQFEYAFPDGNTNWFDATMCPVQEGVLVLSMDITALRQYQRDIETSMETLEIMVNARTAQLRKEIKRRTAAEIRLKKALEAEKSLRRQVEQQMVDRADFMRVLVHELRTPLTALLVASDLLTQTQQTEVSRKLANQVNKGAWDMGKRVNELFDLAKGELGRLTISRQEIEPCRILSETLDYFTPEANQKGISLVSDWPPGLPYVWGDYQRINQILNNLINNSLKNTDNPGQVTLRARVRRAHLQVDVEDTGRGIPADKQPQIFKPHHKLNTQNQNLGGMGIGLAISKMLVELHGGRIWFKGLEKGTRFSFTLPLVQGHPGLHESE
jgi:PAS domain S-box-containing protein